MTTITYGGATATRTAPAIPAAAPKRKNLLRRFFDAFTEAQMRRAEREIRLHRHLLPADFELAAHKLTRKNEDSLPFVR
jgi:hypothetical protein